MCFILNRFQSMPLYPFFHCSRGLLPAFHAGFHGTQDETAVAIAGSSCGAGLASLQRACSPPQQVSVHAVHPKHRFFCSM